MDLSDKKKRFFLTPYILVNSFHFMDEITWFKKHFHLRLIHRIDGPTTLIRGQDNGEDKKLFSWNNKFADLSVFQSEWSLIHNFMEGHRPINPILIRNATTDKIFFRKNKSENISTSRRFKIISSSWSNNPRKGLECYKWLDANLDFSKYEYTFVGRIATEFKNIKIISPLPSKELAEVIQQQDIYITASENDPCSNSLIEALACGLPAIALNSGGHPEIIDKGGLVFNHFHEIPDLLDILSQNYQGFQNLIQIPSMDYISHKYAKAFHEDF
jgi:glycosyltransferase involved in cell wall biosynthesis